MPTAKQIEEMVAMIKSDRDSIKTSLHSLVDAFGPLQTLFSGGVTGMLSGMFSSPTKKD
jgi:hypothetical protein